MQILVTHTTVRPSRVLHFSWLQLLSAAALALLLVMLVSTTIYHLVFVKAAREGWPVVNHLMQVAGREDAAQRDRYLRENLDVMARKVGELQAKLIQLEAMSDRVSGLAGIKPQDLRQLQFPAALPAAGGGKGGPYLPVPAAISTLADLDAVVQALEATTDQRTDVLTLVESRLFEKRLAALMVPNSLPVDGKVGSGFGFRADPFTGRAALHTGLDFPADSGTQIQASAGGVVMQVVQHPQYGLTVELDHGRGLVTRYAHCSRVLVKNGDLVKRGQVIAEVGSTGRSTGPHLHFEVLVEGVPQDPAKFLAGGAAAGMPGADLASLPR